MNPVQQKISCVYMIGVSDDVSSKRGQQNYKVTATSNLNEQALSDGIGSASPTEKIDGTCCLIALHQGMPWLWARHDRKPNKSGERKFAQFKKKKHGTGTSQAADTSIKSFSWNPETDFKEVPNHWIPASGLTVVDGIAMPDKLGHTPGWVPVEKTSRQHCWHRTAVDFDSGLALALRESDKNYGGLILETLPLTHLVGQTCELVGTNVNGNPYGFGSKKHPIHFLIPHGILAVDSPPPVKYEKLVAWFESDKSEAGVEGIVWHCDNGQLYKLHRHHLDLQWPVSQPRLCCRRIKINVNDSDFPVTSSISNKDNSDSFRQDLWSRLFGVNGLEFDSLQHLHDALYPQVPPSVSET